MNGWLVAAVCALYPMSGAAAVVIDSFTEGSISIGYANDTLDFDVIAGLVADQRRVWGNGVSNWTATLADGSGDILYGVDLRGAPSLSQWLNLHYSKSSGYVDLLGYSGFTISFSALTGQGRLAVIFNDRQGTLVPITADGVVEYPFECVLDGRPIPEFLSRVQFRVFAGTSDFSVRINEIAVVPEPAPVMLLLASGAAFLTRRRTTTTGSPGVIRSPVAHHPV